jgi:hypothetical protein
MCRTLRESSNVELMKSVIWIRALFANGYVNQKSRCGENRPERITHHLGYPRDLIFQKQKSPCAQWALLKRPFVMHEQLWIIIPKMLRCRTLLTLSQKTMRILKQFSNQHCESEQMDAQNSKCRMCGRGDKKTRGWAKWCDSLRADGKIFWLPQPPNGHAI